LKTCWRMMLSVALLLSARAWAQSVTSQQIPPPPTIQVTSRLVVLDVVVTDKQGRPVTDLTKDDFNITEEQKPQQIKHFEGPDSHTLPTGDLVHSTADLPKIGAAPVDILVLDELNTNFEDNAFSRYSIDTFLKNQGKTMPPTTLLVANDKSFMVLKDYTQDRMVLEAALKRDPVEYPQRMSRNGGGGPDAMVRLAQSLETLQSIAQASAGTVGRKTIIWVGKGFPSVDLTGMDEDSAKHLQDAVRRCVDIMLKSRVTLYIVDPSPLNSAMYDVETPEDLAATEEQTGDEPFSNAVRFSVMAPATGGRVFSLRNDVDREISSSIRDSSLYYTLAYAPTGDSEKPGEYRHIRVTLKRPGLVAATRDGYYDSTEVADPKLSSPAAGEEVVDVATAALSKMVYNGVRVRVAKGAEERVSVAVTDASLGWKDSVDGLERASISLVAVYFSSQGKVLGHRTEEKVLESKAPYSVANSEEVFTVPLAFPVGTTRIRFIVRSETGRIGTADLSVF
jgi:VWFA-related protein